MEPKERPILFKAAMVLAIMARLKTMTRRVAKLDIVELGTADEWNDGRANPRMRRWEDWGEQNGWVLTRKSNGHLVAYRCPYGQPGDRLFIKETWNTWGTEIVYRASMTADGCVQTVKGAVPVGDMKWRSPLFMPRKFSRLLLEINAPIRLERLQDITEDDAIAEGIPRRGQYFDGATHVTKGTPKAFATAVDAFHDLWDSINAKPKPVYRNGAIDHYESFPWSWHDETANSVTGVLRGKPWIITPNPWVWVVPFGLLP